MKGMYCKNRLKRKFSKKQNSPMPIKETEFIIENFPRKKNSRQDEFIFEFWQKCKEKYQSFHELS